MFPLLTYKNSNQSTTHVKWLEDGLSKLSDGESWIAF